LNTLASASEGTYFTSVAHSDLGEEKNSEVLANPRAIDNTEHVHITDPCAADNPEHVYVTDPTATDNPEHVYASLNEISTDGITGESVEDPQSSDKGN